MKEKKLPIKKKGRERATNSLSIWDFKEEVQPGKGKWSLKSNPCKSLNVSLLLPIESVLLVLCYPPVKLLCILKNTMPPILLITPLPPIRCPWQLGVHRTCFHIVLSKDGVYRLFWCQSVPLYSCNQRERSSSGVKNESWLMKTKIKRKKCYKYSFVFFLQQNWNNKKNKNTAILLGHK